MTLIQLIFTDEDGVLFKVAGTPFHALLPRV